ncbi:DUF4910 domain-containing protein [Peribacillus sp. NPDC096540]|uniref:DUF4910 domain-containing protein n=1 Tax=Peribacillus sp. NPDC096540 TaxID=3390612 RepID=UPI003D051451
MKKGTKILGASLLVGSFLFSSHSVMAIQGENPSEHAFDNKVIKRIDVEKIYQNLSHLAVNIGPRVAGTQSEQTTVDYITDKFREYGLNEVEVQPFQFIKDYKHPSSVSFKVNGRNYETAAFRFSNNTPSGGVSAEFVYAGLGTTAEVAHASVEGKIALIKRGTIPFTEKMDNAKKAGAIGVVFINTDNSTPLFSLPANESNLPVLFMKKSDGDELISSLQGNNLTANMSVEGAEFVKATSHNVIATKKPMKNKDTNQIIIVGAHHDSVSVSSGASDNASGTSIVLELARVLENAPSDTEIRFITFGAEENGLLGSKDYAQSLTKDEINRTVAMFNMDMVGSKNAGEFAMFTYDGKPNTVTTLGNSAGTRLYDAIPYNQIGRSDHQPFTEVGIPAAVFTYAPLEPEYHTAKDTIELISKEKLLKTAQVLGAAIYQAARPDTPALERSNVAPIPVEAEYDEDLHL